MPGLPTTITTPWRPKACWSWIPMGLVLLSSSLITRTLQQDLEDYDHEWYPHPTSTSSMEEVSGRELLQEGSREQVSGGEVLEGCPLCRHAPLTPAGAGGGASCRCKQYKFMGGDERVAQFYNVDQCSGVIQVPNFTLACTDNILELSLSNNVFGTIQGEAFRGLSFVRNHRYLSELRLSNVSLRELHPAAFKGIQGTVHVLDLSHNQLGTLPEAIVNLPGLQKLLLNDNGLTLESLHGALLKARRRSRRDKSSSLNVDDLKVIDLSDNYLHGVPDLLPLLDNSSELQELRLHGNPIREDLSTFVPLLAKHRELQKLTWPLSTVTCSCPVMATLARSSYSDFNFPVIYPRDEGGDFTEWAAVTCDVTSVTAFVNRPIGLLSDEEVHRECWDWVQKHSMTEVNIAAPGVAAAATQSSGYAVITSKEAISGGGGGGQEGRVSSFLLLVFTQICLLGLAKTW